MFPRLLNRFYSTPVVQGGVKIAPHEELTKKLDSIKWMCNLNFNVLLFNGCVTVYLVGQIREDQKKNKV